MKLFLVRHGYSIANSESLVTGDTLDVLHTDGELQVASLGEWAQDLLADADFYVTSDWSRASQTARSLLPNVTWKIDPRVGETNAGDVKNVSLDDFLSEYPDFYSSNANRYPNGESHLDLNERVSEWLDEMVEQYLNKKVVLVAHSGPISCLVQKALDVSMTSFPAFLPCNASVSRIDIKKNGNNTLEYRLKYFSAGPLSHLDV